MQLTIDNPIAGVANSGRRLQFLGDRVSRQGGAEVTQKFSVREWRGVEQTAKNHLVVGPARKRIRDGAVLAWFVLDVHVEACEKIGPPYLALGEFRLLEEVWHNVSALSQCAGRLEDGVFRSKLHGQ
jgi:hypothetical protein